MAGGRGVDAGKRWKEGAEARSSPGVRALAQRGPVEDDEQVKSGQQVGHRRHAGGGGDPVDAVAKPDCTATANADAGPYSFLQLTTSTT